MSPPRPAPTCTAGPWVCLAPCASCHRSRARAWLCGLCRGASACVGTDSSALSLPDRLWVPAALPSASRLGSACQLANAVLLLVPAHLYPCLGGDRAVTARTGLGCAYEAAAPGRLLCPCSAQHLQGQVLCPQLCSRPCLRALRSRRAVACARLYVQESTRGSVPCRRCRVRVRCVQADSCGCWVRPWGWCCTHVCRTDAESTARVPGFVQPGRAARVLRTRGRRFGRVSTRGDSGWCCVRVGLPVCAGSRWCVLLGRGAVCAAAEALAVRRALCVGGVGQGGCCACSDLLHPALPAAVGPSPTRSHAGTSGHGVCTAKSKQNRSRLNVAKLI